MLCFRNEIQTQNEPFVARPKNLNRLPLGTCRDIQGYHFSYDAANRLKAASFWERTSGSPTINDKYSEPLINYDLNGNITQYQCRGLTTGTTYDQIDLMVYTYDAANPDRLYRIADLAPSASRPYGFKPKGVPSYYGFDNAGNMTSDGHKDLTMAYNALNLPDVFTFANVTPNNKIEIVYNAAGEKLEKQVYTGATLSLHKRYVMGIEYTGTTLEAIYHAEGRIVPIGGGVFRYEYTLKDHLGNSRVMFAANGTAIQLLQENHYYPFGMEMKGAWITQSGTENGYQYNGKELNEDWGLNWSDYGARWYDASVGRWNAIDPLAEKYMFLSPYNYVSNNPIIFIDPNGKEIAIRFNYKDDEGERKEQTVIYRDGKLYDTTGKEYTSGAGFDKKGNLTGFLKDTKNSLDKIRSTNKGLEMINSLQKGSYKDGGTTVLIKNGSNDATMRPAGKGKLVEIGWMRGGGAQMLTDDGNMGFAPEEIGLAHELAHAWDHQQGTFDNTQVGSIGNKPILAAEYYATYVENRVREELNYPLRTFYSSIQDTDKMGTPLSTYTGVVRVYDPVNKLHVKSSKNGEAQYYTYKFNEK